MSTISISSVVEKQKDGAFLLKWEVSPYQEGTIDIYASSSDSSSSNFAPISSADINDQFAVINSQNNSLREFFMFRAGNAVSGIFTNRFIEMSNIKNFRDLGGYFTESGSQLKWGKLFRSGDLTSATKNDKQIIKNLGIKTIIDFRTQKSTNEFPVTFENVRVVKLPIPTMNVEDFDKTIEENKLNRNDAILFVQEAYVGILENYKDKFAEMFNILTYEDNYPVVLSGSLGKDRIGLASYLILCALGVTEFDAIEDYMLSQNYINILNIYQKAHSMPEHAQEGITAILSVNRVYINYAIDYIKQKYGSVDEYLRNELKLTDGKRVLLKKCLLYNKW